jgi:Leucine-rich repeat (LRR) protein
VSLFGCSDCVYILARLLTSLIPLTAENNLIGELPPEIGVLKSLETLILSNNCLHGTIPPELGKLSSLIELDVSGNYLSSSIPKEFYNLAMLAQLNLAWNNQEGSCDRSDGTAADLKSAGLEGEILGPQIAQLSNLQKVLVHVNNFSGTISSEIGLLSQLGAL